MQQLLIPQFSWSDFFTIAIVLIAFYLIIRFLYRIAHSNFLGQFKIGRNILKPVLLVYEPLAILLLVGIFIMVNPVFHALLLVLVLLIGATHIKNYLSGCIVQLDKALVAGNRLKTQSLAGTIASMDRLGLRLHTRQGLQFINYSRLIEQGYMLLPGEEISGLYNLSMTAPASTEPINYTDALTNLLAVTPYLDSQHRPKIHPSLEDDRHFKVSLMVREANHLSDLITLMKEQGYDCKISKK